MRLSLLLMGSAATVCLCSGCQRQTTVQNDPEWWHLESQREEKVQKLALLHARVQRLLVADEPITETARRRDEAAASRQELVARRATLRQEIATLTEDVSATHDTGIAAARSAALGRTFPTFTPASGRSFSEVTITRVTDIGIEFRHQNGTGRLVAADLTPKQREAFGIELADSLTALEKEKADARAFELASVPLASSSAEPGSAATTAVSANVPSRTVPAFVPSKTRLDEAPRLLPTRYYGGYYSGWYPYYSSYTPTYTTRSYYYPRSIYRGY